MSDKRREKLLPVTSWPTEGEARAARWFQPVTLGPVEAETRTWVPAMVPWRSNEAGEVTADVIAWYERFARGKPGVLVVEATGIRDVPSGPLLRAGDERFVEGLTRLVDAVKRASGGHTRVFIQLIDFLAIKRRPQREVFLTRFLTLTPRLRARLLALEDAREQQASANAQRLDEASLGHASINAQRLDEASPGRASTSSLQFDEASLGSAVAQGSLAGQGQASAADGSGDLALDGAKLKTRSSLDDAALRAKLVALDDEALRQVLDPRDFEALRFGLRERVTDTHLPHIAALPQVLPELFAAAADRCARAGFDGIELHYAHAYTMASFLSARNDRQDGYGGAREHRLRLPLEVFRAVRARVPASVAVGCRYLADEIIDGGNRPDDAAFFGLEFAKAGFDFLSLSRGGKFEDAKPPKIGAAAYPYTGPSGHECMPTTKLEQPWGRNVEAVAEVKRALVAAGQGTPVVLAGGIATFEQAEACLARGAADVVASARQSLADPDWFEKLRQGRGGEVRRCLFTSYCEGLDQSHQAVTCQLWDRVRGLPDDATVSRARDGRRLLAP